jgi:hypothetical protein
MIQTGFAIAALIGMALVAVTLTMGAERAEPKTVVADPVELALAELIARPIQSFDETQIRVRLARHIDPSQRTAAQLRNAHRAWARRVADVSYGDPVLARDMEAITATALALRGLRPHPDI